MGGQVSANDIPLMEWMVKSVPMTSLLWSGWSSQCQCHPFYGVGGQVSANDIFLLEWVVKSLIMPSLLWSGWSSQCQCHPSYGVGVQGSANTILFMEWVVKSMAQTPPYELDNRHCNLRHDLWTYDNHFRLSNMHGQDWQHLALIPWPLICNAYPLLW